MIILLKKELNLLCPNCNKELIIVERNKIELDYCPNCEGFWFDDLEWDLLLKRLSISSNDSIGDLYSIPKAIVNEKVKKCPKCAKKMDKFLYYDLTLDRCPEHHGVWFDKNEISGVFNSLTGKKETPIEFLGEIFYKN